SCLIPAEAVQAIGYPLPLFFQWDDIEFGYRARANGFRTVTLPGAGLWHQDFDWKDLDEWNRYFSIRNAMITAALHGRLEPLHAARVLLAQIVRNLLAMQYGLTATIIKAAEDFLEGPKILADGGTAAAADVRKLRARYPDTKRYPVAEVPGFTSAELPQVQAGGKPRNIRLELLKRLAEFMLGRSKYPIGTVGHGDSHWWHVSLFDAVAVTDASQQDVRLRRRDRQQMIRLFTHGARVLKRVIAETPARKREYQAAAPELTSSENWKRLYRI
ncbi:MAG: glycosyltransferase, partial [Sciscionella sp.]